MGSPTRKPLGPARSKPCFKRIPATRIRSCCINTNSGDWLQNWYTDAPQANYEADFFNTSGTGYLETQLQAIEANGDNYVFRGFFWFQGEGDTGSDGAMDVYAARFTSMLDTLRSDLGLTAPINFTLAVIDANPDSFYDTPANLANRTRADIERMRSIQFAMATDSNGSQVDTRGYNRTDAWHLDSTSLIQLGTAMAQEHIDTFAVPEPSSVALLVLAGLLIGLGNGDSAGRPGLDGSLPFTISNA